MKQRERNYGIDLLRIVSMVLILCLHIIGQGGLMVRNTADPSNYNACWLLEAAAMCAVNCYGLVSGYIGVNGKFRAGRIVELWLQVFFYSAGITLVYHFLKPGLIKAEILQKSLLPVTTGTYWYFSGYFVLFFVMPFINKGVQALSQKELKQLVAALVLCFSVLPCIPKGQGNDFLQMVGGYSFVWLAVLYTMGAAIRRMEIRVPKKGWLLLIYLVSAVATWAGKLALDEYTRRTQGTVDFQPGKALTTFHSPTVVLCAVCLLLFFREVKPGEWMSRLIAVLAPATFSVYVFHLHPLIWSELLDNAFVSFRSLSAVAVIPAIFLSATGIFLVLAAFDQIRIALFRLLHIRQLGDAVTGLIAGIAGGHAVDSPQ